MAIRSVRLDAEAEEALQELMDKTGASLSALLKQGLLALRERELRRRRTPWEVYSQLDLGPGGYTRGSASESGASVRAVLREKQRKQRRRK